MTVYLIHLQPIQSTSISLTKVSKSVSDSPITLSEHIYIKQKVSESVSEYYLIRLFPFQSMSIFWQKKFLRVYLTRLLPIQST